MKIYLDSDICNSIDYYNRENRYYKLQDYIDKMDKPRAKIINYGFAGPSNGGFCSHFKQCCGDFVYHHVLFLNIFGCNIYIDYDAMEMLKEILEKDNMIYVGSDFDFLFILNEYMKRKPHFPKKLILKREEKARELIKSKAINIAIECLKQKTRNIW